VLINLVSNAIKFTSSGEVFVHVKLIEDRQNNIHLQFSVRDTGLGIAADKIGLLFSPFTQADSSLRRKLAERVGSGYLQKIVELLNGKIWMESTPGEGSIFYFTLNAKKGETRLKELVIHSTRY
jgi:signal transduction histidine kinase